MSAETVMKELAQAADPKKAAFLPRFFKTGPGEYAEGDQFLGVTVPLQRAIARRHRELPLPELAKLVESPLHEHRLTGFLILTEQFRKADEATRTRLFAFCRKHLAGVNNWDIVDLVAPKIFGEHMLAQRQLRKLLYTFAGAASLWKRRIAIISTQTFIRLGDFEDTCALGTDRAEPTVQRLEPQPGDVYLLCSDGLYEPLGSEGLVARMALGSVTEACEVLVSGAYEAGGRDNITAVVMRVTSG